MEIPESILLTTDLIEAKKLQLIGQKQVIQQDTLTEINYVAGVDIGFKDNYRITKAAIAILEFPSLELVESATIETPTTFPYIPGYLSFREVPAILQVMEKISIIPDLILCDGQGYAHPRRFGLACHLGVILDLPTIGVAKKRLIGEHDEVGNSKGDWQYLRDKEEIIGAVVRTRSNIKPVYVSIGHKISLPTAIAYVLQCTTKYRLPETTRYADRLASN
jgi:deoxyribonuclease V